MTVKEAQDRSDAGTGGRVVAAGSVSEASAWLHCELSEDGESVIAQRGWR